MLSGKPVLAHAVLPFLESRLFDEIVITVCPSHIPKVERLLEPFADIRRLVFVEGGESRSHSVRLGLLKLAERAPDYVLIHDGARPWVDDELIGRVLEGTRRAGACIPVIEAPDAVKEVDSSGYIQRHLDRRSIVFAQTPQGFLFSRILEAHRRASGSDRLYVDDAEVYAEFVGPVLTVPGSIGNTKITYPRDLMPSYSAPGGPARGDLSPSDQEGP